MSDAALKTEPNAENTPLMNAYTSAEVANDARNGRVPGRPTIDKSKLGGTIIRAFKQFLGIPMAMCLGGILLAVVVAILDRNAPGFIEPFRQWLVEHIFPSTEATLGGLNVITAGLFGLTTFTFSTLLIALQQAAGAMGMQVVDGFLSRKRNQVVLGFLLSATIFTALTRVIGDADLNPAIGAFLALTFTLMSVFILGALFFMVTNQSRPTFVVDDIRQRTLLSREHTHDYLIKTRRQSVQPDQPFREILTGKRGYVADIDFECLRDLAKTDPEGEIELVCEIGDYMIFGDPVARIRGLEGLKDREVRDAITQDSQRSLQTDPTSGLTDLYAISWRTGSAAQQNQETTVNAVNAMSDILVHWLHDEPELNGSWSWNVVYPDTALFQLLDAIEYQFAVASASIQPMPVTQLYSALARTMDFMRPEVLDRVCDLVVRSLSKLEAHYLTLSLERTLIVLADSFRSHDRAQTAAKIEAALETKRETIAV